ncbi:hypothetical protein QE152_g31461 [Popillia japonica]|uniref:Uncharacterized protein n=1 Tax=Popillia japonica TaxID=7064 RepID=A0AAW1J0X8_POPJA
MYHFEIFVFAILAFMHHVSTQYVHNLSNYTADYPREKILAAVSKDDSFRTNTSTICRITPPIIPAKRY